MKKVSKKEAVEAEIAKNLAKIAELKSWFSSKKKELSRLHGATTISNGPTLGENN